MEIILTSHGDLCTGLLQSYEMIAGNNERIHCVALTESGISEYRQKLHALLDNATVGHQVLILCDIKGGTPYNESYAYMLSHPDNVRVLYGVNLPMLLEAGFAAETAGLDVLAQQILDGGRNGTGCACHNETFAAEDDELF